MNNQELSALIVAELEEMVLELVHLLKLGYLTAEAWLRINWLRLLCFLLNR